MAAHYVSLSSDSETERDEPEHKRPRAAAARMSLGDFAAEASGGAGVLRDLRLLVSFLVSLRVSAAPFHDAGARVLQEVYTIRPDRSRPVEPLGAPERLLELSVSGAYGVRFIKIALRYAGAPAVRAGPARAYGVKEKVSVRPDYVELSVEARDHKDIKDDPVEFLVSRLQMAPRAPVLVHGFMCAMRSMAMGVDAKLFAKVTVKNVLQSRRVKEWFGEAGFSEHVGRVVVYTTSYDARPLVVG